MRGDTRKGEEGKKTRGKVSVSAREVGEERKHDQKWQREWKKKRRNKKPMRANKGKVHMCPL